MKPLMFTTALLLCFDTPAHPPLTTFKQEQLRHDRVATAYRNKTATVMALFKSRDIEPALAEIFIRAFKDEQVLEVWARNRSSNCKYTLLIAYDFCSRSGGPGPKRRQGDMQTPEGFYYIDRFNPNSLYLLSLGIDYPNQADRIAGAGNNLGGDIFIHGKCATIGCIPITDDKIQELYVLAVEAISNGQASIPVHIFPARMNTPTFSDMYAYYEYDTKLLRFWDNLKPGYEYFEKHKALPVVSVNGVGRYCFE